MTLDFWDLDDYQLPAVDHIVDLERCALWIDMGLGKTVITLTAALELLKRGIVRRVLVVGPLRVARKTWPDEVKAWAHLQGLKAVPCIGTAEERLAGLRTEGDIHLINRENIPWLTRLFYRIEPRAGGKVKVTQLRRTPWDLMVLDESTSFQSTGSWWTHLRYLQRNIDRVVELTADAIPDSYEGLWPQMYLLDQGQRLGGNISTFRKNYFYYDTAAETHYLQETGAARIQQACADICMTLREEDWLDLPPMPEPNIRTVELTRKEHEKYLEMRRHFVLELEGQHITAVNAGVAYGKLLQLSNGACYTGTDKEWVTLHDHKLRDLEQYLKEADNPVIIVYTFIPDRIRIEEVLQRSGLRWRLFKSDKDEDDWNANKLDALLMHPKSGGHGSNMHHGLGDDIYWYGHTPSNDLHKQMNGRIFGGRRRLLKPNGRISYCIAYNTHDMYTMKLVRRKALTGDNMRLAMVELRKELTR